MLISRGILPAVLSLAIVGCATNQPKNVSELRDSFKGGGTFLKSESHTVKRDFKAVIKDFENKAMVCFNGVKSAKGWDHNGYYSTSSTSFVASMKRESDKMVAFTIQDKIGNAIYIGGVPQGGSYNFLADIERINKSTTKITLNGIVMKSTGYFESVLAWANGKDATCPL